MNVIVSLRVQPIGITFRAPVRLGTTWVIRRHLAVVRIEDGDGRVGLGECIEAPAGEAVRAARAIVTGRTTDDLRGPTGSFAIDRVPATLRAAIDAALLDLAARQADLPAARVLGGDAARSEVAVNALMVAAGDHRTATASAVGLVAEGYRALKVKLQGGASGTAERWWTPMLAAIRSVVGGGIALRLDLNGVLTPDAAMTWLPSIARLGLEYVEQPVSPRHGWTALARLRSTGVPIAADEAVVDPEAARTLLDAHACDALVVKPARVGGPTRARQIVEAAQEAAIPVTVSTLHETALGLATALHVAATVAADRAHGLATAEAVADDPVRGLPPVVGGRIGVPGPGLGVSLP